MHAPSAIASRSRRPAMLLLALLPLAGCDSIAGDDGDGPAVEGQWTADVDGRTVYLAITRDDVTVYQEAGTPCYYVERFGRVERDGDVFTLREPATGLVVHVTLRREDERLRVVDLVTEGGSGSLFVTSDVVLADVAVCDAVGTWVSSTPDFIEYLEITATTLTVYSGPTGGCLDTTVFEIVERAGRVYRLMGVGPDDSFQIIIELGENQLSIANALTPDQPIIYQATEQDLASLDLCGPGPDDPSIDCLALPGVQLGDTIAGELTADDAAYGGWFYDLYGLIVDGPRQVQIDVRSETIDGFLRVFAADGTFIDGNDNVSPSTTDASVTVELDRGCHRIEASTAIQGEVGAYTLTVN